MSLKLLLIIISQIVLLSCNKNDSNDFGYPDGVYIADMETENNCTLPECSDSRITRLIASKVNGKIKKSNFQDSVYLMNFGFSFDSYITFYFCNLQEDYKEHNLEVEFSGQLKDACGKYQAIWPIEEAYIIKLTKITKK